VYPKPPLVLFWIRRRTRIGREFDEVSRCARLEEGLCDEAADPRHLEQEAGLTRTPTHPHITLTPPLPITLTSHNLWVKPHLEQEALNVVDRLWHAARHVGLGVCGLKGLGLTLNPNPEE